MKRYIEEVAGANVGEQDASGDVKKLKGDTDLTAPAALVQPVNEASGPTMGASRGGGGGGRGRGRGGRGRPRESQGSSLNNLTGQTIGLNALQSGEVTIKSVLNLKKEMAGAVIGRGGSKVQKMREDSGALIHVCPPVNRTDVERAVEITGLIDKVKVAENMVYGLMVETDQQWTEVDSSGPRIEIHVLPEMVGCVMGKGGARVKALREEMEITIHVETKKDDPDLQMVIISGTAAKAHAAHVRIVEHLKEFDPSKSKMLLKRIQGGTGRKIEPVKGVHPSIRGSTPMVVMPGSQMPSLNQNPQVLIQQPDGTYTLAQVVVQGAGSALPMGTPSISGVNQIPLGGGLVGQAGTSLLQQPAQVPGSVMNFGGQMQDGGQFGLTGLTPMQPLQGAGTISFGAGSGLDVSQQPLGIQPALQGGSIPGQLPPSNPNAHQFGN
eukprot:TRINITY_DN4316_c0_g1_i1.p1 TRINITY_DN4316_c0_g1~~TRINITY_DN4316_c0_g1_i1.p1  ORF type:complete len:438 (-),score=67.91 TRINITY_DN4316_c0_g1_i1:434-1747(-)